jgi:hypothetical protein
MMMAEFNLLSDSGQEQVKCKNRNIFRNIENHITLVYSKFYST